MRLAIIQLFVTDDKIDNVQRACEFLEQAKKGGADIAVLPEMFCCPYSNSCFPSYAEPMDGFVQTTLSETAARLNMTVVAGSYPEFCDGKIYNTSCVYGADGSLIAKHRKMHLFDIDVQGGQRFFESETLTPGNQITTFETEFGKFGLCICFDMRFEELSRIMALDGAQVIIVPGAFNMTTGPAHWELLFRQRAVDNQLFTVGVAPARDNDGEYVSYAHSMAVSPWGKVLCDCGVEECVKFVEIDIDSIYSIRKQLPILSARRSDIYEIGPINCDKE